MQARQSEDHPWMSVLQWPAPGGPPRFRDVKNDDLVLLLTAEAGYVYTIFVCMHLSIHGACVCMCPVLSDPWRGLCRLLTCLVCKPTRILAGN
jgi:hypothetical protein